MKRASQIEALLRHVDRDLLALKTAYQASLHEKKIRDDLKIDIKNIFENLRSCLDYVAHDIAEEKCTGKVPDCLYFPIRSTPADFQSILNKNFPALLQNHAPIYVVLESVQPYKDPWLGQFNKLNNNNKHQELVEQVRVEGRQVTVNAPGGGSVSWGPGVTFGSGVSVLSVPIDPRTQLPVPNNSVSTQITTWVDFQFKEIDVSALPFIEESAKKVREIFNNLQKCF